MNLTMLGKPPKPGEYQCNKCNSIFQYDSGDMICPNCGNNNRDEVVPIMVDVPKEEGMMHTDADFPGG